MTEVLTDLRRVMPSPLLGFDTDNDSVFINETIRDYCVDSYIEFTRCRPYRKNDQAYVEQKNGSVVRRIVGYHRYEAVETAATLAELYRLVRLFVNFFQPSSKLLEKQRNAGTRPLGAHERTTRSGNAPPRHSCRTTAACRHRAPENMPSVISFSPSVTSVRSIFAYRHNIIYNRLW